VLEFSPAHIFMKIMESLKKGGFGGAKMFTKEDLEGLSADEMAEKVWLTLNTLSEIFCQQNLHNIFMICQSDTLLS
jgi:hypothetical protein